MTESARDSLRRLLLCASLVSCGGVPAVVPPPVLVELGTPKDKSVEGGFSDLAGDPRDPTGRTFLTISDRGANDPRDDGTVYFPAPGYHQKISRLRLEDDGTLRLLGRDSIRVSDGSWTTGLPSPLFPSGKERATTGSLDGRIAEVAPDSAGYDFEGLAAEGDSVLWASEEYGPRIVRMERATLGTATIRKVWSPGNGLPAVFSRREANKGLEALCRLPDGRILSIFQGALANAIGSDPDEVARHSLVRRVVVLDPRTGSVQEFVAEMDDPPGKAKRRTKIGACTPLDGHRVLVLEHHKAKSGFTRVDLAVWDLSGASDVGQPFDPSRHGRLIDGRTLEEAALEPGALAAHGIRPVSRSVVADNLTKSYGSSEAFDKPEGLALTRDGRAFVVFDNDFAIHGGSASSRFLLIALPPRSF